MKSLISLCVLVAVASLASSAVLDDATTGAPRLQCSAEVSDQCPAVNPSIAVHLPDPDNCNCFCECDSGVAYQKCCQDGTYYDIVLETCNWPANVECGSRPKPKY